MKKLNLKKFIVLAMFAALSFASLFVLHIGGIGGFLSFDVKDAIIMVASMIFDPFSGILIALLVSLIEMFAISTTQFWGFLMNFISTAVFAAVGSSVYKYAPKIKKTMTGAVVGLFSSVVATTAIMIPLNLIITPIYTGLHVSVIASMILPLLLPFNALKSIINASIVLIIYKPVSISLKATNCIEKSKESYKLTKSTVVLSIIGLVTIIAAVLTLIFAFGGRFEWIVTK